MALELNENGKIYHWIHMETICRNWTSSKGSSYNTGEVVGLMLACIDNLKLDDPEAGNIADYVDSFTSQEREFLKWIGEKILK